MPLSAPVPDAIVGWTGYRSEGQKPLVVNRPHATSLRLRPPNSASVASVTKHQTGGKSMYRSNSMNSHLPIPLQEYKPNGRHESNPLRQTRTGNKENLMSRPSSATLWRSTSSTDFDVTSRPSTRPVTATSRASTRASMRPVSVMESNRSASVEPLSAVHSGTIKASFHLPGYCGHLPASSSNQKRTSTSGNRKRDGSALSDNFLLNMPGYTGFVPRDVVNEPHTKRLEYATTSADVHRELPIKNARPAFSGDTRERGPKSPLPGPAVQMHALRMSEKGRLVSAVRSTCDF